VTGAPPIVAVAVTSTEPPSRFARRVLNACEVALPAARDAMSFVP